MAKKKITLDDDATMQFAAVFVMGIAAVLTLAVTTAVVVGVVALVKWVA